MMAAPHIDYLAKDFASFRRLLRDRISALVPGPIEDHPADLGTVLIEALSYAADHISYYQDAVATEAYLGTVRQRISVRRHARLRPVRARSGTRQPSRRRHAAGWDTGARTHNGSANLHPSHEL
jgi:hypothetical protein